MVLDYSPLNKDVFNGETLDRLIFLCDCGNEANNAIQSNAIWALKNLIYRATLEQKQQIFCKMDKRLIFQCLRQKDEQVQMQTLNLIRNSLCNSLEELEFVVNLLGENDLFDALWDIYKEKKDLLTEQMVYVIVNLVAGSEEHSNFLFSPNQQKFIVGLVEMFSHSNPSIRKGALWAICNMTSGDENGVCSRISQLRDFDVDKQIKELLSIESDPTVYDLAKKAISAFQ